MSLRRVGPLLVVGLLLGAGGAAVGQEPSPAAPTPTTAAAPAVAPPAPPASDPPPKVGDLGPVTQFRSVRGVDEVPAPARLRVPAVGVDADLVTLGRAADGTVEVPSAWETPGWFAEGARPGEPGPAVILGHVDSRAGPAVFVDLHALAPGDEVLVDGDDGSTARFVVERVEQHDKDAFPTRAVYYPTLDPVLRLVTCGGAFDPAAGSYTDNVVVFATLADPGS